METQEHMEAYQELFSHMANEHGLTLLQSEMDEIIRLSKKVVIKYDSVSNVSDFNCADRNNGIEDANCTRQCGHCKQMKYGC